MCLITKSHSLFCVFCHANVYLQTMFWFSDVKYYIHHEFRLSTIFCHVSFSIHYYIISSFLYTLNENDDLLNIYSLVLIGK